jgi:hypothetical protein
MRQMRLIAVLCLVAGCGFTKDGETPVVDPNLPPPTGGTVIVEPPAGDDDDDDEVEVPDDEDILDLDCDADKEEVAEAAEDVLGERCSACHGEGSEEYGGFGSATDAVGLVDGGWAVPGDPDASKIFIQIDAGTMPTASGGGPLESEERDVIQKWIECGAPDWAATAIPGEDAVRGFIPPEALYEAALDDAQDLDVQDDSQFEDDQVNARYLSLVHLYNAGVSTEEITRFSTGLNKLVWSLSREDLGTSITPVNLDGIDFDDGGDDEDATLQIADGLGDKLLFRVDMKEFGWDAEVGEVDVWEEMVKLYPLAINFAEEFDAAEDLQQETKARIPIVNGDWFLGNASQPPLYFDMLDVPDNIDDFMLQFGGIVGFEQTVLDDGECAGMDAQESLVSNFNRVSCRMDSSDGYCYASFDFASQADTQDIFEFPDTFFDNEDGGEAFCALPNGQQAYLVYAANGQRLDNAPIQVVSDFTPGSGGEVITGLSCFNCHSAGVIERSDQLRVFVEEFENEFEEAQVAFVQDLFPTNDQWADIYANDVSRFTDSLENMTPVVEVLGTEPIYMAYRNYDDTVLFDRVAGELALPNEVLEFQIESDGEVNQQIGVLLTSGKIDRESFELDARNVICTLELGGECDEVDGEFVGVNGVAFCGLSAVPCLEGSTCNVDGTCTTIE